MKSEKQLSIFGKQKYTKVLQIFAFQKIASVIDAEAPKGSFASITDAIGPDCWTHYIKFLKFDRREKNKVSKEQMNKMKNSTIKDLLEKVNISRKYKNGNKFKGKELYTPDLYFEGEYGNEVEGKGYDNKNILRFEGLYL